MIRIGLLLAIVPYSLADVSMDCLAECIPPLLPPLPSDKSLSFNLLKNRTGRFHGPQDVNPGCAVDESAVKCIFACPQSKLRDYGGGEAKFIVDGYCQDGADPAKTKRLYDEFFAQATGFQEAVHQAGCQDNATNTEEACSAALECAIGRVLPTLKDKYNSDVSRDVFRVIEAYYKFYMAVQISQNFEEDMSEKCDPLYSRSISL